LVAHYAYNLNVADYFTVARENFERAAKVDPDDVRPPWFWAVHLVQSANVEVGMNKMMEVAKRKAPNQFPTSFWEDYAMCANLAEMPAHTLMALDFAERISGRLTKFAADLRRMSKARMKRPVPQKTYEPRDSWTMTQEKDAKRFTNWPFGFSLVCPDKWLVDLGPVQKRKVKAFIHPSTLSTIQVVAKLEGKSKLAAGAAVPERRVGSPRGTAHRCGGAVPRPSSKQSAKTFSGCGDVPYSAKRAGESLPKIQKRR
jgi:hypothetical protein